MYAPPSGTPGNKGGIQAWILTELRSSVKSGDRRMHASITFKALMDCQ